MNPYRRFVNNILVAFVFLLALQPRAATAQQTKPAADSGFSFAAYGDSRPMMYLPPKAGQPDLVKLFVEMFGLVMPEKIAEEVVKKDATIFDPVTKELIRIIMPFMTKTEVMTLTGRRVGDQSGFVERTRNCFRVYRRCSASGRRTGAEIEDVQLGRAKFVVNSGDVVWWGNQGRTVNDSPYWKRVNDTQLEPLPPPDSEMRAAGLEGRWFIGVGTTRCGAIPRSMAC